MGSAAYLILEDGTLLKGRSVGSEKEVISEVVFNTSMTGYLEVLTDPSYAGQAVVMTYPLIGNYGICFEDMESERPWLSAFIVREFSRIPSNFRSEDTIQNFLKRYDIPGISGIDTRALTRVLREKGTMNGMITTKEYSPEEISALLPKIRAYRTGDVVSKVTCGEKYEFTDRGDTTPWPNLVGSRVELEDDGQTQDGRRPQEPLPDDGIISADDPALAGTPIARKAAGEKTVAGGPDRGEVFRVALIDREVRKLYDSDIPIFAICLGHQLMALAAGGDTYKLKYGHRGGNHPVKDLKTGRVYISSQNHGYAVDPDSLPGSVAVPAFRNVNDGTNEGMSYTGRNIFTVQFHPEACPGPQDSGYLFDRFVRMMSRAKREAARSCGKTADSAGGKED